jgi:hypothetical protein
MHKETSLAQQILDIINEIKRLENRLKRKQEELALENNKFLDAVAKDLSK